MNRNINLTLLLILPVLAFVACEQRKAAEQGKAAEQRKAVEQEKAGSNQELTTRADAWKTFSNVAIPDSLVLPEDRAAYLVTRYWDNFDFSDTTYIHTPEVTEQAFVNYLSILPYTGKETAEASITAMLTRTIAEDATGRMYPYFLNLYRGYLYDPNSPMRNDEFYIPVAEYITGNPVNDLSTKERARFDLSVMLKNRQGTVAADFGYITAAGVRGTLHKLNKDYTIVYFHNPDCTACEEAASFMNNSSLLNHLQKSGKLDILALYADDDLEVWNRYRNRLPSLWISARDEPHIIRDKAVYELRAMPTLYLLDKNKKVLLKDIDAAVVEAYFAN